MQYLKHIYSQHIAPDFKHIHIVFYFLHENILGVLIKHSVVSRPDNMKDTSGPYNIFQRVIWYFNVLHLHSMLTQSRLTIKQRVVVLGLE